MAWLRQIRCRLRLLPDTICRPNVPSRPYYWTFYLGWNTDCTDTAHTTAQMDMGDNSRWCGRCQYSRCSIKCPAVYIETQLRKDYPPKNDEILGKHKQTHRLLGV